MTAGLLQFVAIASGFIAAMSAAGALVWAVWTYRRNAASQMQLLALGALQHYLDLAVAHPDLASHGEGELVDARYGWFAAHALVTAQTLWTLGGSDENWRRTVDSIIRQHRAYLTSGAFACSDYRPDFVGYLRSKVPDLACADTTGVADPMAAIAGVSRRASRHS